MSFFFLDEAVESPTVRRLKEIRKEKKKPKKRKANHELKEKKDIFLDPFGVDVPLNLDNTHSLTQTEFIQGIWLEERSNISITKFDGSSPVKDRRLALTVDEVIRKVGRHPIRLYLTTQRAVPSMRLDSPEENSQTEYVSFTRNFQDILQWSPIHVCFLDTFD